jgi:hypothetical protein
MQGFFVSVVANSTYAQSDCLRVRSTSQTGTTVSVLLSTGCSHSSSKYIIIGVCLGAFLLLAVAIVVGLLIAKKRGWLRRLFLHRESNREYSVGI